MGNVPSRTSSNLESSLRASNSFLIFLDVELPQLAGANIVYVTMDLQSSFGYGIDHKGVFFKNFDASPHIELDQLQRRLLWFKALQQLQIVSPHSSQGEQPSVDQAELFVAQSSCHTTAFRMSTNDNMLDFQVLNGVLDNGEGVEVRWGEDVGDVSVDKDITRLQAEDGRFRASRV
jgi:hypothetical protein